MDVQVPRWHQVRAGTRVAAAGATGLAAGAMVALVGPWQVAVLAGWDVAAAIVVGWVIAMGAGKTPAQTQAFAAREDVSRATADLLIVSACVASLGAVGFGLVKAAHEHGLAAAGMTAVAVVSVALAWSAVHAVFTLRYAHLYYAHGEVGGIDFGDDEPPDYHDFAYVAVTIGMTYQVSDTDLTTKLIRRTAARHALLSYVFGTVIVAMMINVVAGLLR